jgi:hypothetical protein
MIGPLDDDKILVAACRDFIVDFIVAYEVMPAHTGNEYRHRDDSERAWRGIIARAIIDAVHGVGRANRIGTQEGPDGQEPGTFFECFARLSKGWIGHAHALDNLRDDRAVVFEQFLRLDRTMVNAEIELHASSSG